METRRTRPQTIDYRQGAIKRSMVYGLWSIVFLLVGCSKSPTVSQSLSKNDDTYKIAVAAPQFGPYKALGLSIVHGAELAVDLINQSDGIGGKKIELVNVDDGGLAGEATLRARSLVDQMVLGVIGHLNSDISIPASEVYSKAMIPEISPASTSPLFTERKPVRGYVFRTIGRDDKQGKVSASFVLEKGYKKIAVLYNNRSYGQSLASEFVKEINSNPKDAEIVFYETYKVDTKNYAKEINSIKSKSPNLVFFVGEYGDAAKFLKQMKNLGLSVAFLGSEGVFDQEFIEAAKNASEGALVISLKPVIDKDFLESYKKKFNKELGAYSANSFDATNILVSAIKKVKEKNPEKIASVIKETKDYPGLSGKISFDANGDLLNPAFSIYQVKNGMFMAIK
ncbi:MAG: branched-chain amino acid ABC transporter substrate-binding protein [Candidatus Melainabacteria bacterium]|nr:branched-chain amino acid ABC transporter substrate-binding protein [Candidatus Melainabacteria bacterium]